MANAYQQLVKAKFGNCSGRVTKASVRKKASAYVRSAVKAGKTRAEATRSANKVLNRSCSVGVGGKRRKKKSSGTQRSLFSANTGKKHHYYGHVKAHERRVKGPKMKHVLVMGRRKKHRRRRKH